MIDRSNESNPVDSHHLVFTAWLSRFGRGKEVYYTKCLTEGHPCLVAFDYGSVNNFVSQRLVEKTEKERIENQVTSMFKKDKHVNETHQLPCLKRKLDDSALLCIWYVDKKQIRQTQCMELFIVTYQGGLLFPRNVIDGLQPLESN